MALAGSGRPSPWTRIERIVVHMGRLLLALAAVLVAVPAPGHAYYVCSATSYSADMPTNGWLCGEPSDCMTDASLCMLGYYGDDPTCDWMGAEDAGFLVFRTGRQGRPLRELIDELSLA